MVDISAKNYQNSGVYIIAALNRELFWVRIK